MYKQRLVWVYLSIMSFFFAQAPVLADATHCQEEEEKNLAPYEKDSRKNAYVLLEIWGLKNQKGRLRVQAYSANPDEFLEKGAKLLRVERDLAETTAEDKPAPTEALDDKLEPARKIKTKKTPAPDRAPDFVTVCFALPEPGSYALAILHDMNKNGRADIFKEGFGFSRNPKLGLSKPDHKDVLVAVPAGLTQLKIDMHYLWGDAENKRLKSRR